MPFIPNTDADRKEMLSAVGVSSIEDLLKNIPESIRLRNGMDIPAGLSEYEVLKELHAIASQNSAAGSLVSFMGGGAYDHYIPAAVGAITSRSEFSTSYTPYQAEVSQGTLQAIYEYQTMVCNLTGMDVANASMYDGGSALAEAALLAVGHTGRREIVVAGKIHPHYLAVIRTYCEGQEIQVKQVTTSLGVVLSEKLKLSISENTAAVIIQNPNFYGCLEDGIGIGAIAHSVGALFITAIDPISLGVLSSPGDYGADVVVGEGQVFGNALNFGGPFLGMFAVKEFLLRKIPGRLSGVTVDAKGERGFVLTVQTREQHIRRDKATSNICTNEGLVMLAATVYLALLGKSGLQEIARLCLQKSHYFAERLSEVKGFRLKYSQPFFREFVLDTPAPPHTIISQLIPRGFASGIDLRQFGEKETGLLVAVTEKRSKAEMDRFVEELGRRF